MRRTFCVPATLTHESLFQMKINKFWKWIENHYEEEWRVHHNGDLILIVDDPMLERVLTDNYAEAWLAFGTFMGGQKDGKKFLLQRPENLIGEYIIKGVYDANQRLVNGEREYFFLQG